MRALLPPLLALFLGSCRLVHANMEFGSFSESASRISGTVHATSDQRSEPVLVVALSDTDQGPRVLNYEVLLSAGVYNLLLPPGKFRVVAFEDLNQDFVLQPDEPTGELVQQVDLSPGSNLIGLDIQLGAMAEIPAIDLSDAADNPLLGSFRQTIGNVVSLDEARFSRKSGVAGMWRPLTALSRDQMGVFFLAPYDPCKVPVLFVHGMEGSPQDLRPMIEALDRKHFQPWFLAYPSGLRLRFVSVYLAEAIRELGVRYKPYRMHVVAHSMGGLIARSFINQNVELDRRQLVRIFITVSTPFNGHAGAQQGVRFSPVVAPAWIDMVPNSAFIMHLYEQPLPEYIEHYLFFGYQSVGGPSSDGVVMLSSVLDPRAQFTARGTYGYDETHSSILASEDVILRVRDILESRDRTLGLLEGCATATAGGSRSP